MKRDKFQTRIKHFSTVRRGISNNTLMLNLAFKGLTALFAGMLMLSGIIPNAFVNLVLFAILLVYLLSLPITFIKRYKPFESFMKEAFYMEALMGNLNSRLISALDFIKHENPSSLMQIVIERAEQDLKNNFESKLERVQFKKWLKQSLGMTIVCLLSIFVFGKSMINNLNESWNGAYNIIFPISYVISPNPSETHVLKLGEKIDIGIEFNRDSITEVTLVLKNGDDELRKIPLEVVNKRAVYTLSSKLQRDYDATFKFGERETEILRVIFTSNPVLENMQTELIYPTYTRLLPKSLEGIQQRIIALSSSRITFGFTFSKEISRATIFWDDGSEDLAMDAVGRFASISLIHTKNRVATIQVEDVHGLQLESPLLITFIVQNDEKPEVILPSFIKQDMPMQVAEAKVFGFGVRMQDDFGVQRCVLNWNKTSVDNPNAIKEKGEIERMITPPRRKTIVEFSKIFESISLVPGDKIVFNVQVFDNHRPNAQSTKSSSRSFFIFKDELDDWNLKQAGMGGMSMVGKNRLKKEKRETTIKSPSALRVQEKFLNEFDAENNSKAKTATIRGPYQKETANYFQLMSEIAGKEE